MEKHNDRSGFGRIMPELPIFRILITSTGLLDVQAPTQAEALAMVEKAIRHNGLALAGKVLMNPTAILRPMQRVEIQQPPTNPKVHELVADDMTAPTQADKVG